ncbi:hypothetical protein GCM10010492_54340 [Saccharothrix mutabilis subsp. mutabilis]|uniref:Uncharacterized protein n=1 Tax=Saccharothrix mutabilis subsp. mutabilis TaxID=66855 RepID=A0ABN0UE94_9PSEU
MHLECAGFDVLQLRIDWAVTFVMGDQERSLEVRVEGPFELRTAGAVTRIRPEGDAVDLAPVLGLVRQSVENVDVFREGLLVIGFGCGATLSVLAGDGFEAWQISGQSGVMFTGDADGGFVTWGT